MLIWCSSLIVIMVTVPSGWTSWVDLAPARHDSSPLLRALSSSQELAQLLCGYEMPQGVLKALLNNSKTGKCVTLVNLSPYDSWLEKVCLSWHVDHGDHEFRCVTLSHDLALVSYSERSVAMHLLEDCRDGTSKAWYISLISPSNLFLKWLYIKVSEIVWKSFVPQGF